MVGYQVVFIVTVIFLGQFCPIGNGAMRLTYSVRDTPVRQGQTITLGTMCPTSFDKCVGSFTSPANNVTLEMQEMGPTVYSP